jgi:hypothetical protein
VLFCRILGPLATVILPADSDAFVHYDPLFLYNYDIFKVIFGESSLNYFRVHIQRNNLI